MKYLHLAAFESIELIPPIIAAAVLAAVAPTKIELE